jgi:ABC-type transporter Mla subunit MlaD
MLAAITIAAVLVFNLQPIVELTRRTIHVVAVVEQAPGVNVGTEVWVEGVKVGRVKQVSLIKERDSTLVALDLRLERRARALITRSSDVRASRRRFIAEPLVRVFAGSPTDPPIQSGDTIRGKPRLGPEELLAQFEALGPAMDSVLAETRRLQGIFERRQPAFEHLAAQIQATTSAAAGLSARMETGSLGPMLDAETGLPAHVRTLRARMAQVSAAADDMMSRYGADGALVTEIRGLGERARAVDAALAGIEERMEAGGGFLWRIQADTAVHVAVRAVGVQIDSMMAEAASIALRMFLP